ncbi:hypothetical protein ACFO0N_05340 [Halobium salinum]|uniref:Uncharacterized protein n=1 Tax=Halobium salinum TaxID=1364940 RepID=A0ABD5P9L2_9EURY|nr:hypothetical protein [Halobium salinum]
MSTGDDTTADAGHPPVGRRRETATLSVIPPAVPREAVESTGRVGAVAYPYRVYDAAVSIDRAFMSPRRTRFVASVDRSRRLVVRADTFPEVEERTVEDVLVLPSELSAEVCLERAEKSVFQWTLRKFSTNDAPDIEMERTADVYKLFWLARRPEGDVIVDSVRGSESPLVE